MNRYDRELIIRFLIDNTPMIIDLTDNQLKYDSRNIYYKIYKYITELEKKG